MGLADLPGYDGKVTSDKKVIFISYQRGKGGKRDYRSFFSVIFETSSKFTIFFLRLVFGKVGVTGPQRECDIR